MENDSRRRICGSCHTPQRRGETDSDEQDTYSGCFNFVCPSLISDQHFFPVSLGVPILWMRQSMEVKKINGQFRAMEF